MVTRLARVGYYFSLGFLDGGMDAWSEAGFELDRLDGVTPEEFGKRLASGDIKVLDVRKESEYKSQHLDYSHVINMPLDYISKQMEKVQRDESYYVHCTGGYRSVIAASILKARGFDNLIDIEKGFKGIQDAGVKTTEYVCPTTML